jgi:putative aminopeptidase FrvX
MDNFKYNFEFLTEYLQTPTPAGFEILGQKVWLNYGRKFLNEGDSFHLDHSQSGFLLKKSKNPNALKVAITAHVDEIGMTVESVTSGGYITVFENGGIDPNICQGKPVQILTRSGKILNGITTTVAPHFKTAESKKSGTTIKDINIDLGIYDRKEVEKLVQVGDPVVFKQNINILNDDYLVAKGLDNKISGFVLVELLKKLQGVELPFDLYMVNCVQEEIGKRGAELMARLIKPDLTFVLDVGHDTTSPGITGQKQHFCSGLGPLVLTAPAINKKLFEFVMEQIETIQIPIKGSTIEKKTRTIPHQLRAKGKITGTDADVFSMWSPLTGLFQIPIKYMHSTVESCSLKDVSRLIRILEVCLKNLGENFLEDLNYKIDE